MFSTVFASNEPESNALERIMDVIVIGAGISGLCAAKYLSEYGLDVVCLEALERVGGRTYTKRDPIVKYVDLGGAYVEPNQYRVLRVIKDLGLQTYRIEDGDYMIHYKNGKRTRFRANRNPFIGGLIGYLDLNNIFRLIDTMAGEVPVDAPWDAPHAQEWDRMTYKEFLDRNTWTACARDFASFFIRMCVTSEPYESSLLWMLWYVKQCGGTRYLFGATDGGQERKIIGGSQQICERLADGLNGTTSDRVLLNKPVVGITQTDNEVMVRTLDGCHYRSKYLIMALAPAMQHRIHFSPALPPLRNQLNQRCPMGSVMKCIVYYETAFWRKNGLCGSLLIEGLDELPVPFTMDDTKPDGTVPALVGFIVADKCRLIHAIPKEERLKAIIKGLSEVMGTEEALYPIHYEEHNWMADQYSGGCYTMLCPPGFLTTFGPALRAPIHRMYFAGSETATEWAGYLEGGVQAGERAAREILCQMGRMGADSIWQTEPQSEDVLPVSYEPTIWERYLPSVGALLKMSALTTLATVVVTTAVIKKTGLKCLQWIKN